MVSFRGATPKSIDDCSRAKSGDRKSQGNRMNMVELEERDSPRPYGARKRRWGSVPGLRFASSGAIFVPSLREDGGRILILDTDGIASDKKDQSCNCPAESL